MSDGSYIAIYGHNEKEIFGKIKDLALCIQQFCLRIVNCYIPIFRLRHIGFSSNSNWPSSRAKTPPKPKIMQFRGTHMFYNL